MDKMLFSDLFSGDKIIADLHGFKIDFQNRMDGEIDNRKLKSILHQLDFILDFLIYSNTSEAVTIYKQSIDKLKKILVNYSKTYGIDKDTTLLIEDLISTFNENETAPRNIKNVLKKSNNLSNVLSNIENNPKYNIFISDYDRIISSSGIRRLQDKTQVYPLEKNDFVRTRLTHSHEVASISELIIDLLSKIQIENIKKESDFNNAKLRTLENYENFKLILRSSSLIHDIGNPPFGHFGEDVIRSYFDKFFKSDAEFKCNSSSEKKKYKISCLPLDMQNDFIWFDGNAQGLRVITKLQQYKSSPLNLSSGILGSIIKYPYNSSNRNKKNKFGYFYSEYQVIELLKIKGVYNDNIMNPLALLLEACDDIANFVSDFEDAIKKGIINYEKLCHLLSENVDDKELNRLKLDFKYLYELNKIYENQFEKTLNQIIAGLKKVLIQEVSSVFSDLLIRFNDVSEIHISDGDESLIEKTKFSYLVEYIKDEMFKKNIYTDKTIIKSEIKGSNIITNLLEVFTIAILELDLKIIDNKLEIINNKDNCNYKKHTKLFSMISSNFIDVYINEIQNNDKNIENDIYFRLRLVVDFLSGMTDTYIEDFHNQLFGK